MRDASGVIPEHWPSRESYLLTITLATRAWLELSRLRAAPFAAA
jgi:hypothetical protein